MCDGSYISELIVSALSIYTIIEEKKCDENIIMFSCEIYRDFRHLSDDVKADKSSVGDFFSKPKRMFP